MAHWLYTDLKEQVVQQPDSNATICFKSIHHVPKTEDWKNHFSKLAIKDIHWEDQIQEDQHEDTWEEARVEDQEDFHGELQQGEDKVIPMREPA